MCRLRDCGKSLTRQSSADAIAVPISENKDDVAVNTEDAASSSVRAVSQSASTTYFRLLTYTLSQFHLKALSAIPTQGAPPTPDFEAPPLQLPQDITVLLSEETPDADGWMRVYSSLISITGDEVDQLEMVAQICLLELLLLNKSPASAQIARLLTDPMYRREAITMASEADSNGQLNFNPPAGIDFSPTMSELILT